MIKTFSPRPADIERQWHVIDAKDQILGRMATRAASLLLGKHKPTFSPHLDTGDFVVIINAGQVRFTGNNKARQKTYYRHSGYPGGLRSVTLENLMETDPARVIQHAVKGMLPHNRLGAQIIKKLKVYAGSEHPHRAQTGAGAAEQKPA